ncbi:uncharacterized protein LOC127808670 [Diospyros lotus]|uniref:uncharacterized protein LOC127808670 n=1 Tax=Diospyros lotus TaxID=55363 RepID=UPI002259AD8F|nr:uncharacterized protein LOC127808670 [Diospyros lotus]
MEQQSSTKKGKTLLSFFRKRDHHTSESTSIDDVQNRSSEFTPISSSLSPEIELSPSSNPECQWSSCIERDPGKRKQICEYPINARDEIRRAYLLAGSYQPLLLNYKKTTFGNQRRSFQKNWFNQFRWLEYSPSEDKAYCFYCFLFLNDGHSSNISTLAIVGFDNWKRINQGNKCVFLTHVGSSPSSPHLNCVIMAKDLMNSSQHIERVIHSQTKEKSQKNRLSLRASVIAVKLLALQGCAFRGHDESSSSLNRGNFIQMLKTFGQLSMEVDKVILDNAPKNAQYIAPNIQKDILHIMANRVRQMIREDVGDERFCIFMDEAKDESNREQLAIILRFVNSCGILTVRFFAIKSVSNTTSLNLKNEISDILTRHDLQLSKMRSQEYDGANNMRGTWNELQALFLRDYPYAYYVHCFAHRLQLALISAAKDVSVIWEFFSHLDNVINIINSSSQRISELQNAQRKEVEHMLSIGERESGSGANQIGNLQCAGTTRWSSHYDSVKSMISMYSATCKVLEYLKVHCSKASSLHVLNLCSICF